MSELKSAGIKDPGLISSYLNVGASMPNMEKLIFWRQNFYQKASAHLFTHFTALLDMPMK